MRRRDLLKVAGVAAATAGSGLAANTAWRQLFGSVGGELPVDTAKIRLMQERAADFRDALRDPPDYLKNDVIFLGQGTRVGSGVNPTMAKRLEDIQNDLQKQYDALPPDERGKQTFQVWCGLHDRIVGWRSNQGYHSSGSAVDLNVMTCPFIATRTNGVPGGEKGANPAALAAAVAVYDRAVRFMEASNAPEADVSARKPGEDTGSVWDRFNRVSHALVCYFAFAFKSDLVTIKRKPTPDAENASTSALDRIPMNERRDKNEALGSIRDILGRTEFINTHPSRKEDAETTYYRILRDYELVRIPMEHGTPSSSPDATRNPAKGFLDVRRWVAVSMHNTGKLRWGAADFGDTNSGDIGHFDLGSHAVFRRNEWQPHLPARLPIQRGE